jgi:hypothetical protein
MPSGYTSGVYEGKVTDAQEFILTCARAFGATIMMRDEPLNTPIPEFQPSTDYYDKNLERAIKQLEEYKQMSIREAEGKAHEDYQNEIERIKNNREEKLKIKKRYLEMLVKVELWEPPTEDHVNLKEYCIKQLKEGIEHDCGILDSDYLNVNKVLWKSGEQWLEENIKRCERDIEYHTKERKKEVERTNERNLWIRQLKNSFQRN